MWVAVLVLILGFLAVATTTQLYGYRLGGTITVPVLATYTLKTFVMLPIFLVSTAAAYVGLALFRRRTLVYGRDELVAAILVGSLVPLVTLLFVIELGAGMGDVAFVGSILPGLAAYNLHRLDPELRRGDVVATTALFAGLLAVGLVLVDPRIADAVGAVTPPVLFAATADVAVARGAVVDVPTEPVVLPRAIAVSLFAAGFAVAELLRERYGVRIGIVVPVLVATYALANVWLAIMYLFVLVMAFALVQTAHVATLRYGRVVLGVTTAIALALTLPVALVFPVERGLSAIFVGVLAGVTAYNAHVTAPIERRLVVPLQLTVFVPSLLVARLFADPPPRGVPQELTPVVLLVAGTLFVASVLVARVYTVDRPDEADVFATSVLAAEGRS